ncbi:hypothetical protein LTR53_010547, partial [Teratosphaeriaceae sp. CCFEE 6253]
MPRYIDYNRLSDPYIARLSLIKPSLPDTLRKEFTLVEKNSGKLSYYDFPTGIDDVGLGSEPESDYEDGGTARPVYPIRHYVRPDVTTVVLTSSLSDGSDSPGEDVSPSRGGRSAVRRQIRIEKDIADRA